MHDKAIRRRRAVLALLVVISLILLTDYFGNSPSSPLHSVQRGIADVLSPIQDGASRVFSPVRDVTGWISATIHAKSQVSQLRAENAHLATQVSHDQYDAVQYGQDQGLLKLDNANNMKQYGPVSADVRSKDPVLWYDTITVDKGTNVGAKVGDPVIGEGGLVGDVSAIGTGYSVIKLLTAPQFSVAATVQDGRNDWGVLGPAVGNPSTLILNYLPQSTANRVAWGDEVVTAGFKDSSDPNIESLYPPGIPIGTVSNRNPQDSVLNNEQVHVQPSVDLQHLSVVQILTKPHGGH